MSELKLETKKLLADEGILSPQKEAEFLGKISALENENANLKQDLANLKKLIYGQKSEKTEVILENAEQLCIFNEAEENANKEVREQEKDVVVPEHTRKSKRTHAVAVGLTPGGNSLKHYLWIKNWLKDLPPQKRWISVIRFLFWNASLKDTAKATVF